MKTKRTATTMTMTMTTTIKHAAWGLLLAVGCALGVRGQGAFDAEHDVSGVRSLIVEVPATPLQVQGCDGAVPESCPPQLRYAGLWLSTGASASEAERNASAPSLVFEADAERGLARLSADIPLDVEGLVDLELDTLHIPGGLDLDLRSESGDVVVRGMAGVVSVDLGRGNIEIFGAPSAVAARTDEGFVHARTSGAVDLRTASGEVLVEQTAGTQDVVVDAGGDVAVYLASDASVRFDVQAGGDIRVSTPSVAALTRQRFERTVGEGDVLVEVRAHGDVVIELYGEGGAQG